MNLLRRGLLSSILEDMNVFQFINSEIATDAISVTVSLDATVDLSKTFPILLGASSNQDSYPNNLLRVSFPDSDNVTFTKGATNFDSQFQALIMQSETIISLQFLSTSASSENNAKTITSVDTINNRVVIFPTYSYAGANGDRAVRLWANTTIADGTSITSINIERLFSTATLLCDIYIVELRR